MKAEEKNISRHENGTLYLRVRRNGRLVTKSLKTKDLKEAVRKIEALGLDSFMVPEAAREPSVPLPGAVEAKEVFSKEVSLKDALGLHDGGLIHLSKGREEMATDVAGWC